MSYARDLNQHEFNGKRISNKEIYAKEGVTFQNEGS